MSPRPSPTPICHSLFAGEIQPRALVNVPRIMGEGLVGDYIANAITSESQILFDFSLRSLPLREHRRGQGSRRKPLRGEGESPMSHNVARHSYCSTVLQHRIVTLIARNRRFTVDLSGARPRRWKSEFLSTLNDFKLPLRNSTRTLSSK